MIESAVTLLPEPDSPTMASVSPASTSNETSSTAVTGPRSVLKRVVRSRTWRRGSGHRGSERGASRALARRRAEPHSVTHLLLQLLVDPDARIDRAGPHRAGAQLAAVVLHPRPPRRIDVGRRQPDIGRLVERSRASSRGSCLCACPRRACGTPRPSCSSSAGSVHCDGFQTWPGDEALADRGGRVGVAVVHEVAGRVGLASSSPTGRRAYSIGWISILTPTCSR